MISRMVARGYDPDFAQRCFNQIKGFGEYGFRKAMRRALRIWSTFRPGSNAIIRRCSAAPSSMPSRWAFMHRRSWCAMRVSTASRCAPSISIIPIGIARWSRRRDPDRPAVRLGMRQVDGLREDEAVKIAARLDHTCVLSETRWRFRLQKAGFQAGRVSSMAHDIMQRAGVSRAALEKLAAADAFRSTGRDRRQALVGRARS